MAQNNEPQVCSECGFALDDPRHISGLNGVHDGTSAEAAPAADEPAAEATAPTPAPEPEPEPVDIETHPEVVAMKAAHKDAIKAKDADIEDLKTKLEAALKALAATTDNGNPAAGNQGGDGGEGQGGNASTDPVAANTDEVKCPLCDATASTPQALGKHTQEAHNMTLIAARAAAQTGLS